jgi:hypothetical protein
MEDLQNLRLSFDTFYARMEQLIKIMDGLSSADPFELINALVSTDEDYANYFWKFRRCNEERLIQMKISKIRRIRNQLFETDHDYASPSAFPISLSIRYLGIDDLRSLSQVNKHFCERIVPNMLTLVKTLFKDQLAFIAEEASGGMSSWRMRSGKRSEEMNGTTIVKNNNEQYTIYLGDFVHYLPVYNVAYDHHYKYTRGLFISDNKHVLHLDDIGSDFFEKMRMEPLLVKARQHSPNGSQVSNVPETVVS